MNLNKFLIVLCVFIFFLVWTTLGIYINLTQVSQQMLIGLDQQVISLQNDKRALQDEINTITSRTLQLWLKDGAGKLFPVGEYCNFRELLPDNEAIGNPSLGIEIGFLGPRTDIIIEEEAILCLWP